MNKISAVYKITNTVTNDFYIGSSKDVKRRWTNHKSISLWKRYPNNPLYKDMQKYGIDKFSFQVIAEVKPECLKEMEQQLIKTIKPTYNDRNANGIDTERKKEYQKSNKYKEYQKEYRKSNKYKEYQKSNKRKEYNKKYHKEYGDQLCCYNGKKLTLRALYLRFQRAGVEHPMLEAKKYILKNYKDK